jgi:2-polyprenyl-6-methoxyphenol hydroxylase-like FAD-dependent oxidoreductase
MQQVDVAIVGAGIGGTALGGYLARHGLRVMIVERETEYSDRVRGEWMAPWGVAELQRLDLYDTFRAAGAHHISRSVNYDELIPPAMAEQRALPVRQLHPGVPGPLTMQHVTMQQLALANAVAAGADVRRGVSAVQIHAGPQPSIEFQHDGHQCQLGCRLIVGADGRSSTVRRQLGFKLDEAPLDHLIVGLLVEDIGSWPEDLQALGKVGDLHYLIFPQGHGRARLYADYAYRGDRRFGGEHGARELLAAFDMDCVPNSESIANATPIGPCRSYPSQDAWIDRPYTEGAVLMGDAAGYNDPILGQGLSVTLRDARILGEALLGDNAWHQALFEAYADERRERLRRLRFVASFVTTLFARFGAADIDRRKAAFERIAANPELMMPTLAAYLGPDRVNAACFTRDFYARVFGTTAHVLA